MSGNAREKQNYKRALPLSSGHLAADLCIVNLGFFECHSKSLSDIIQLIKSAALLSLEACKNSKFDSHIPTAPVLADLGQQADLLCFWTTGSALLGHLRKESELHQAQDATKSIFNCQDLLNDCCLALMDHPELYQAAMPLMDKELHFCADGSQPI